MGLSRIITKERLPGRRLWKGIDVKKCIPFYALSGVVGSVFQNPRTQFFTVDTTSEIAFGCENLAIDADEINLRIEKTVGALKIEDLLNRSLFALSGGENRKLPVRPFPQWNRIYLYWTSHLPIWILNQSEN